MKHSVCVAAAILAAVAAQPAQAAMIHLTEMLDLHRADFSASGFTGTSAIAAMSPATNRGAIALAEGDTLDYTIRFASQKTLTLNGLNFIWALSYSDFANSMVDGSGTFSFLDANGAATMTSMTKSDREGHAHFGQQFYATDFADGLPSSITFSGVRYTGTLNDYENPDILSRTYSTPAFYFQADSSAITTAVPEASTWAMLLAGFGLIGAAIRRRPIPTRA